MASYRHSAFKVFCPITGLDVGCVSRLISGAVADLLYLYEILLITGQSGLIYFLLFSLIWLLSGQHGVRRLREHRQQTQRHAGGHRQPDPGLSCYQI